MKYEATLSSDDDGCSKSLIIIILFCKVHQLYP